MFDRTKYSINIGRNAGSEEAERTNKGKESQYRTVTKEIYIIIGQIEFRLALFRFY